MEPEKPPKKDNFYQVAFSLKEITDLVEFELDNNLDDEIAAVRVATRRTLEKLEEDLETADFVKLIDRIHKGTSTIASLLRTRRAISDQSTDKIAELMAQAVQELINETGWKI